MPLRDARTRHPETSHHRTSHRLRLIDADNFRAPSFVNRDARWHAAEAVSASSDRGFFFSAECFCEESSTSRSTLGKKFSAFEKSLPRNRVRHSVRSSLPRDEVIRQPGIRRSTPRGRAAETDSHSRGARLRSDGNQRRTALKARRETRIDQTAGSHVFMTSQGIVSVQWKRIQVVGHVQFP